MATMTASASDSRTSHGVAVTNTTGMGLAEQIWRTASTPVPELSRRSEVIRSGHRSVAAATAASREEAEAKLIEGYMPVSATEAEIDAAVEAARAETGATAIKQMGLVMKAAQARLAGKRIDGKMLSEKVKAGLS